MHAALGLALLVAVQAPTNPPTETPPTTPPATTETTPPTTETTPTTTETPPPTERHSLLPPKTKPRMLVMDLTDKGAGPEITSAINQAVQGQAVLSHPGETVTATQIKILLDAQANQQLVGCDSELCMTDIGKLIEADVILGGNVAKVGDDVVITLLTVNPVDGQRIKQEQRKTPTNRDLYYYAAKQLAAIVLTGKSVDPRVPVVIKVLDGTTAVEGEIIVDGKQIGLGSQQQAELEPGQHEIIVKRGGFVDWKSVIDVAEATPVQVTANLVATRVELWPVAIGTGVLAAGLAVTGLVMADYAQGAFSGSSVLFNKDPLQSYSGVAPTNSADLCTREQDISLFAGRAPGKDEAFGAQNECGTSAGPGLIHYSFIGAGVMAVATGALVTTDLILGAE